MLDDRKSAILRAVVQTYIETAQPVGSSHVVDAAAIGVSPATVRSEMTVLEREGYLTQPHTSAGRIPTEKGYRFFVDEIGPGELGPAQSRQVRGFFNHVHGELEEMLRSTSRMLSRLTATTAVIVGDVADQASVRSVQLVDLGDNGCLIVAVLSSGSVVKCNVPTPSEVEAAILARANEVVARCLVGSPLTRAAHLDGTGAMSAPPNTGDGPLDAFVAASVPPLVEAAEAAGRSVHIDGASNIADAFDASSTLREVLGLLEQQVSVVTLLRDVLDRGLTVAIGSETGVAPLAEGSLVVAPSMVGGEQAGTIGVLGPTRMNYLGTLAAVAVVSDRLSRLLTEG